MPEDYLIKLNYFMDHLNERIMYKDLMNSLKTFHKLIYANYLMIKLKIRKIQ